MDIKDLALYLLIGRIIAIICLLYVMTCQVILLIENNPPDVQRTRFGLFVFAILLFMFNATPAIIDIVTIQSTMDIRPNQPAIGVIYMLNSLATGLLPALMMGYLYKDALIVPHKDVETLRKAGSKGGRL